MRDKSIEETVQIQKKRRYMNWVLLLHGKSCKDHLEEDEITLSLRNYDRRKVEDYGVDMRPRPNGALQSLNHAFALSWEVGRRGRARFCTAAFLALSLTLPLPSPGSLFGFFMRAGAVGEGKVSSSNWC